MIKLSTAGLIFFFGGLVLFGFQAISILMETETIWKKLSIAALVEPRYLAWMDTASWFGIEKIAIYLVTMPLFLLLITMGVLLIIISGLTGK